MTLNKDFINALAPNAAAIKNGEALASGSKFIKLNKSEDGKLLFGECKGSGKSNYFVSVDFINGETPVSRCNCPSRQFPCKHGLGIMYAFALGKNFEVSDIPEDILAKRDRQEKLLEKKELKKEEIKANKEPIKMTTAKVNTLVKKIDAQLSGVELAEKILSSIVNTGFASIDAKTKKSYIDQIKNLGNYYVNGIQTEMTHILTLLDTVKEGDYTFVVSQVNLVYALLRKSKEYLNTKKIDPVNNIELNTNIEEQIGYVWKLEELIQYNKYIDSAKIVQLGFYSYEDVSLRAFVDEGYYINIGEPNIYITKNYRPYKALKHIKEDDTIFHVLNVKELIVYPGEYNQRVRFDGFSIEPITNENISDIYNSAQNDFGSLIKQIKSFLKTPLSDKNPIFLVNVNKLYKNQKGDYVIEDVQKNKITLSDISYIENSYLDMFEKIVTSLGSKVAMLLMFENDLNRGVILARPISIVTSDKIIKLLY